MEQLIVFLILVVTGYAFGTYNEKKHFENIRLREHALMKLPITNAGKKTIYEHVSNSRLITGNCVISIDYFKKILAGLQNFFGLRVSAYETLLDRARREAILRMKESATDADIIVNLRIENAGIGKKEADKSVSCVEIMAYATAVYYQK